MEHPSMTALPITDDELVNRIAAALLKVPIMADTYALDTDDALAMAKAAIEASGFLSLKAERDELERALERITWLCPKVNVARSKHNQEIVKQIETIARVAISRDRT